MKPFPFHRLFAPALALVLALAGCMEEPEAPPADEEVSFGLDLAQLGASGLVWELPERVLVSAGGKKAEFVRDESGRYTGPLMQSEVGATGYTVTAPAGGVTFPQAAYIQDASSPIPAELALARGVSGRSGIITLEPLFGGLLLKPVRDDVFAVDIRGSAGERLYGTAAVDVVGGVSLSAPFGSEITVQPAAGLMSPDRQWVVVLPPLEFPSGLSLTVRTVAGSYELRIPEGVSTVGGSFVEVELADALPPPSTPGQDEPPALKTGLRSVFITTPDGGDVDSKDVWTNACHVQIKDDGGKTYYDNAQVGVKGRGNSTWGYPKKPYTLKLPEKDDLIGVGAKGKRWVLLANWMDRTLLRNDVAFEIARRTRLEWTPSGEFVELYINGRHQGNYWLGEQIKVGKGRLDADYLIELDTYYDATWRFYSNYGRRVNEWKTGMPIGVKEPDDDEMTDARLQELKDLVNGVEEAIYKGKGKYDDKIDVASFIDWYLVHEVTYNLEPNHPKSCYFYFRGGVMYAGPVWDFDWYTFVPSAWGLGVSNSIYFDKLMLYQGFVDSLKARWKEFRPLLADMDSYIDARASRIRASEAVNWTMWPCSYDVNGDCHLSFQQSVDRMKQAIRDRISALDLAIEKL